MPATVEPADVSAAADAIESAAAWLAVWNARQPGPDANARRGANSALDAIDDALAELHKARARLVTEMRISDDEAAARADALLARTDPEPGEAGAGQ